MNKELIDHYDQRYKDYIDKCELALNTYLKHDGYIEFGNAFLNSDNVLATYWLVNNNATFFVATVIDGSSIYIVDNIYLTDPVKYIYLNGKMEEMP